MCAPLQVAVISFCIAFRQQLLQRYKTPQELDDFLANIPDPGRAAVLRDSVKNGMDSPRLALAVFAYDKLLADMETAFADSDWLVGQNVSLADLGFLPYIERLEQLQLKNWWSQRPHIASWLHRIRSSDAYRQGIVEWHNPGYIQLMAELGGDAWPRISRVLASFQDH